MEKLDKLYEEEENWSMVQYRMNSEGLHYCFKHYSSFDEIQDEKFHKLRKKYLRISKELEEYVKNKLENTQELISNFNENE
jgi:hypothetical protein